jgi:creatinine amidohydrolase
VPYPAAESSVKLCVLRTTAPEFRMGQAVRRWEDLTWHDLRGIDAGRTVAVLPVAAIEQHGPHLPLATDAIINRGILERALALVDAATPVLVLPAFPVGRSGEHAAFPGTLTLDAETLARVWFQIARSVHRAGLRKLVIVNSHGGQPQVADIVVQDLREQLDMLAVVANTFVFEPDGLFPEDERRHGIHAGAGETSMLLHLRPDTVRRDLLDDFQPASLEHERTNRELRFHGPVTIGWATQDLHPSGACGDARQATAEAGRAIVEHVATRLAVLLDEVSRHPLARLRPGPLGTP